MTISDKEQFVRKLRGVAVEWSEVVDILRSMYPGFGDHFLLYDVDGCADREKIFEAMAWLGEHNHRWWCHEWRLRFELYPRQAQVEQEFDIWFTDKCHEEKKFLPRWFVEKAKRYEGKKHV